MFTPIILACAANACIAIGGPASDTEQACHISVMERGAIFVMQNYPDHQLIDYKCIAWGTPA